MSSRALSSRRRFIGAAGAALAAPMAVTGTAIARTAASPALDDLGAIRALNQAFARHLNAADHDGAAALFAVPASARVDPAIRRVTSRDFGEQDVFTVADDGLTATGVVQCTVEAESVIGPDCPLLDMARQQGGGMMRRTERGVFEHRYVRQDGTWKIERTAYRPIA